jgi:uracil-DNA glycosylase
MSEAILGALAEFRSANVFNPWSDVDPMDLCGHRAPHARLDRLRRHFEVNPSFLLIGEAPGYQGCHFSGVPFTNEALLCDGAVPRMGRCARITSRTLPWREPSATIVWRELHRHALAEDVVMWNAFAFHPHRPGDLHSNRAPGAMEIDKQEYILRAVLQYFRDSVVVAVGGVAAKALDRLGIKYAGKLRHPSMGGANLFRAGLEQLVRNADYTNRGEVMNPPEFVDPDFRSPVLDALLARIQSATDLVATHIDVGKFEQFLGQMITAWSLHAAASCLREQGMRRQAEGRPGFVALLKHGMGLESVLPFEHIHWRITVGDISAERFTAAVGREPENDDLDRCNCPEAGKIGHSGCGWCRQCDRPRFICGHLLAAPETAL